MRKTYKEFSHTVPDLRGLCPGDLIQVKYVNAHFISPDTFEHVEDYDMYTGIMLECYQTFAGPIGVLEGCLTLLLDGAPARLDLSKVTHVDVLSRSEDAVD